MNAEVPPGRASRRSWWTWALAAAVVFAVAIPILGIVAVIQFIGSTNAPPDDDLTRSVQPHSHVDLDTSLGVFWGSATWSVSEPRGWTFDALDRNGLSRARNEFTGCSWTAGRVTRSDDRGEYGDRAASGHGIEQLVKKVHGDAPDATVTYLLPVAVAFRSDSRAGSAEFLTARVDYTDPFDGSLATTLLTARAMPYMSEFMYTVLTCPREEIDADPSMWVDLVAGIVMVPDH